MQVFSSLSHSSKYYCTAVMTLNMILDEATVQRISQSPGLPQQEPTRSYWAEPSANIHRTGADADEIPEEADIVIIGSGITGTSIARTMLKELEDESDAQIIMLEAREVCSGATARNGGHITPAWYHRYPQLVEMYGKETAHKMIKFQLSHVQELLSIAEEDGLLEDSQCRLTESFDVYVHRAGFEIARQGYEAYMKEEEVSSLHDLTYLYDHMDELKALQLNPSYCGVIGTVLGAIHAYRFVTGVLSRLLQQHASNFRIFSNTPCSAVKTASSFYIVETPKGKVRCRHVVHATNAWTSHLLPGFRRTIVPLRGEMSSQRPGTGLGSGSRPGSQAATSDWQGSRSFVFYTGKKDGVFDYLTQQPRLSPTPSSNYPPPQAELMFGGGLAFNSKVFLAQVGNVDDTQSISELSTYLSQTLPVHFEENWGDNSELSDENDESHWGKGRTKASWSGLIGLSADGNPWVGRVPAELADGRKLEVHEHRPGLVEAGEWVCGGYSGEGMTSAWKCGVALGRMILGKCDTPDWLPNPYTVSLERHANAQLEDTLQFFI
ncbi:FAD dependent oxidoreductase-domain-containing protein [Lentinula raphanica]|uniref:FAD dependent oxidoreductase-domain-containing protein n=1 Tax=Lentinula raphanica TaxID=153919 RepID=A0AA38UCU2_9AGAR|nr:FAD dependent oxidoreductase-domain-containing protein [Lentinula raphanica]